MPPQLTLVKGLPKEKLVADIHLPFSIVLPLERFPTPDFSIGFAVKKPTNEVINFYLTSEQELEQWMDHLRIYCYMTQFDKKYTIMRQIDKGKSSKVTQ